MRHGFTRRMTVALITEGHEPSEVARLLGVSRSRVSEILSREQMSPGMKMIPHAQEVVNILAKGNSFAEAAKIRGCNESTLRSWAKHHRIRAIWKRGEKYQSVLAMAKQGMKTVEISAALGMSQSGVSQIMRSNGYGKWSKKKVQVCS
jgi:DNA-binding CsgD family transcriptional regulator